MVTPISLHSQHNQNHQHKFASATVYPQHIPAVLDLIGKTPLVRVQNLDTGPCELFLKLESQNPGGSIKDRIALSMISAAEFEGYLKPGGTLVEATAGNTGLGLALIASLKGYKLKLVIPDKMSAEKIYHLRALGAEVIITRSDVEKGHPDYYQDKARALAASIPGAFYVNQFENPANPETHERTTGPEIWKQVSHQLDAVIAGVGSGGTFTGLGRYFKRVAPHVQMVLADPQGSILAPTIKYGVSPPCGSWLVEGIGEDFIPTNFDTSLVSHAYSITDAESINTARLILQKEGILCGSSSGTLIAAALRYCREQTTPKRVVTLVCDSGNKYLSKIFNPYWLDDQGLVDTPQTHDLRDLIARPYQQGSTVVAKPEDTPHEAFLTLNGLDTLALCLDRQVSNAVQIANFLQRHPAVETVQYSGLPTSPQHERAQKYLPRGAGALLAFNVLGKKEDAVAVAENLQLFSLAANIGQTRSLVIHPATTTHRQSEDQRRAAGIAQNTLRLSIGIENPQDLIRDLEQALGRTSAISRVRPK